MAENGMIVISTNNGKSLAKTPEQNKTQQYHQVSAVAFSVTPASSIDYDGGWLLAYDYDGF